MSRLGYNLQHTHTCFCCGYNRYHTHRVLRISFVCIHVHVCRKSSFRVSFHSVCVLWFVYIDALRPACSNRAFGHLVCMRSFELADRLAFTFTVFLFRYNLLLLLLFRICLLCEGLVFCHHHVARAALLSRAPRVVPYAREALRASWT